MPATNTFRPNPDSRHDRTGFVSAPSITVLQSNPKTLRRDDLPAVVPRWIVMAFAGLLPIVGLSRGAGADDGGSDANQTVVHAAESDPSETRKEKWKDLKGKWDITRFGGEGPVTIEGNSFTLGYGDPLTGVHWTGKLPKDPYELRLEAKRTDGFDFFAAVTFPVGKQHCSLVLGGWGGGVTGISNIDGQDASSNETTFHRHYKNDQWYKVRIRVFPEEIVCQVDGRDIVEVLREDVELSVRGEMDPSKPLGIANYQCGSEIRGVQVRQLTDKDWQDVLEAREAVLRDAESKDAESDDKNPAKAENP